MLCQSIQMLLNYSSNKFQVACRYDQLISTNIIGGYKQKLKLSVFFPRKQSIKLNYKYKHRSIL